MYYGLTGNWGFFLLFKKLGIDRVKFYTIKSCTIGKETNPRGVSYATRFPANLILLPQARDRYCHRPTGLVGQRAHSPTCLMLLQRFLFFLFIWERKGFQRFLLVLFVLLVDIYNISYTVDLWRGNVLCTLCHQLATVARRRYILYF